MRYSIPLRRAKRMLEGSPYCINFSVAVHLRGDLRREALESAFARLAARHPLLGARAIVEGEEGFLTDDGAAPVPILEEARTGEDAWVAVAQRDLPLPFDFRAGPLLRCAWLRGEGVHDLVLVVDHMTADGRSSMIALRDLMALLADPALELPPVLPMRIRDAVSDEVRARVDALADSYDPGRPPTPWTIDLSDDPQRLIPIQLSAAETAALAARCKGEGVTVQAAIMAAFALPFAERDPSRTLRRVEVPVDLRPMFARPVGDAYGSYLGLAIVDFECAGKDPWEDARAAHAALLRARGPQLFEDSPAAFGVSGGRPLPAKPIGYDYDLSVSNLGRIELPAAGDLAVELVHAPTFNVRAKGHRVLGLCAANGRLGATYTSCDPAAPGLCARGLEALMGMIAAG